MSGERPRKYKKYTDGDELSAQNPLRTLRRRQQIVPREAEIPPQRDGAVAGAASSNESYGDPDGPSTAQLSYEQDAQEPCSSRNVCQSRSVPSCGRSMDSDSQLAGGSSNLNLVQASNDNVSHHEHVDTSLHRQHVSSSSSEESFSDGRPLSPANNLFSSSASSNSDDEDDSSCALSDIEARNDCGEPSEILSSLKKKFERDFSSVIGDKVVATRGELLLNAMELCKLHHLPHDVHANVLKLVNTCFSTNVLPDTRYLLDELYMSSGGMNYHFYCLSCSQVFPTLQHKSKDSVMCLNEDCNYVTSPYSMWKAEKYFVIIDLHLQLQLLFGSGNILDNLKSPFELVEQNAESMRDLHGGTVYKDYVKSLSETRPLKYISLTICIDGTPLYKSSGCSVSPLFAVVNELPPHIRFKKLLLIGFWFGDKKPDCSSIFEVFVAAMKPMSTMGVKVSVQSQTIVFCIHVIACCVDSGARGSVQEVHQHNGQYGCSWCLHPDVKDVASNARRYSNLEEAPILRTKEDVLKCGREVLQMPCPRSGPKPHVKGVVGISLLMSLPLFDILDGMIVDSLHAKFLGVARQFSKLWFGTDGVDKWVTNRHPRGKSPPYYIGTPGNIVKVNKRISSLTPTVETRRMPRDISDIKYYKARDWENWVFYFSVPVMSGILPDTYLNHWCLFVEGCYLLAQQNLSLDDIDLAETLLLKFVADIEDLYQNGDRTEPCRQITYNVHLPTHAAQNARRWGADWCISAYAFEAGNMCIKNMIESRKGIANKIMRQVSQDLTRDLMRSSLANTAASQTFVRVINKKTVARCMYSGGCTLLGDITPLSASEEEKFILLQASLQPKEFLQCSKVIKNHCVYTSASYSKSSRRKNSFVRLADSSFVLIRKFIVSELSHEVYFFASAIRVEPFCPPNATCVPNSKRFMFTISLIEVGVSLFSIKDIDIVCVYSCVKPLGKLLTPMPHIFTIS